MRASSNDKKVRGWRRQIARVAAWQEHQGARRLCAVLEQHAYAFARIDIDPWFRVIRREPPYWLRRLMLRGLIAIHDAWRQQLERSGECFYLGVWLYHPRFIESQVVAGVRERVEWYQHAFNTGAPLRRLPIELEPPPGAHWTPHVDQEMIDDQFVRLGDVWVSST